MPRDLLKFNLPEFDLGFAQFGGGMVNLNPIPDAAYEFTGLPTPTRPDTPEGGDSPAPIAAMYPLKEDMRV